MNDYTLSKVFDTIYRQEFSEFGNLPKHFFSLRHRKAMKEILYPSVESKSAFNRNISIKRRVIIALLVIILSALSITAGAAICRGFTRKEHGDNTELFAVNAENAPKTIEYVYYLSTIPDGYELYEKDDDKWDVTTHYINRITNRTIVIHQTVKEGYNAHIDNEHSAIENIYINGCKGLYLNSSSTDIISGTIIWDNCDYILSISGDFDKITLVELAKTLKISE